MELAVVIILIVLGLITFMTVSFAGLAIWGAARLLGAVRRRLFGNRRADRLSPPPPPMATMGAPRHATSHAAPQHEQQPPTPTSTQRMKSYEYLDVDGNVSAEHVINVMRAFERERVIGFYAHEVITTLSTSELRKKSLFSQIDNEFTYGSISWDHFSSTATAALDAILRNCALLGNRVQAFDVEDYERMEQFYRTGGEMRNGKQDPARLKRWELIRNTKDEMDELRSANEQLLLELGKLSVELDKLSSDDADDDSARIAEEVSRLVDETKYYR